MARMILESMRKAEVVEGFSYLLVKHGQGVVEAAWTGKGWAQDGGPDLPDDWPDAVFASPTRGEVSDGMTFERYEKWAKDNTFHDPKGELAYPALGVCGEAGEFAEKVKKMLRDDGGRLTPERREGMLKELGDVLFYLAMAARMLESGLDEVARKNMEKLASRKERGELSGDGDDR